MYCLILVLLSIKMNIWDNEILTCLVEVTDNTGGLYTGKKCWHEPCHILSGKFFLHQKVYLFFLKVEREKMGTAEDQNQMFARLAGRVCLIDVLFVCYWDHSL